MMTWTTNLTFAFAASIVAALVDVAFFLPDVVGRWLQEIVIAVRHGFRIVPRLALPLQAGKKLPADVCVGRIPR